MQGAAWGLVIVGAVLLFLLFYPFGLLVALISALFGASIGLFMVIFFEMAHIQQIKLKEQKKQTELLTKIASLLEKDEKLSDN